MAFVYVDIGVGGCAHRQLRIIIHHHKLRLGEFGVGVVIVVDSHPVVAAHLYSASLIRQLQTIVGV